MVSEPSLEEVIAERKYDFNYEDGRKAEVVVRIARPVQLGEAEWSCPYEIQGPGALKRMRMVGVDSLQALLLTLQVLLAEFDHIAQREHGTFELYGGPALDLPDYRMSPTCRGSR
jgi:hypothetical protein